MVDQPKTAEHWAYRLPPIVDPVKGHLYWAHDAIAEHEHPEYWAWMWGYSEAEVKAAKETDDEQP